MGRPKGDGARSKSRPSSSSLAASLLPQGSTPVGFGGYMGCSRVDSTEDSPPFLDIDSEVAQHLKRLSRKDPTTKLKALTSLSQLFQQKTAKEIMPITPQWAFEYKKLLLDYNREVRRATHVTMTNLVGVVGRDIAPYLKSLMGPWWFSQFDSAYEVSQAAKRSFQAAFPAQDKRLDVLILYTSEIFRYIEENLKLTPQSMSDKNVASDELEEMHKQVVSSSLLALATLLDIVVTAQSERPVSEAESKRASKAKSIAISCAENLLTTHKLFLEFLKSQSSAIRSATYSVMRSLIKNIPHAIKKTDIIDLADAILGAFRETDPSCHSSMWDVILLFSRKFPESWSSLKIKKSALSRFWHFLRNGCFGSQQVSYPALVLFLDVVPAQAVEAQKFLLEVLQNLWAGRSLSYSSHLDRLALFEAMKECFLFSLKNTDRYSDAADPYRFQQTLADQILLKLLWHEYLFSVSSNNQERVFSSMDFSSGGIQPSHQASRQLNVKVTEGYAQDLGKCIVEILTDIFLLEPDLLLLFCSTFQETCLGVFQETDSSIENGEGVTEFLSVVNQQAVRKGETWPLVYLVGPTLSKSFPLIRTLDSPNAVRFMVAAVSIFSPRKIIQEIFCIEPEGNQFLHVFKETFIPWCLQANSPTTSVRLDLLLSLLDDEYLAEQWASIIMHATNLEELKSVNGIVSSDCLSLLAMLIEKAITRTSNRSTVQVPYAAHWHHHLLDSAAVFVVQAFPPFGSSNVSYMRAVLGGIAGDDETNFLSRSTLVLVFEEILKKLTVFMMDSPFIWVKVMCSVIPVRDNNTELGFEPSMDVNEMADFALQVLDGGFSALKCLHHEVELLSGILAAIFVIKWECSMATVFNNKLGEESTEKIKSRFASCELVHALHRKICNQFLFSINTDSRNILESILVQTVRSAVLKDENMDTVEVTSLCSHWVLELLECLCQDQFEVQKLLDRFLSQDDSWPVWVAPDIKVGKGAALVKTESASIDNPKGTRFVALIDRLIPKMGFDKIIAGAVSNTSSSLTEDHINQPTTTLQCHYSRAWLAAEILCTWTLSLLLLKKMSNFHILSKYRTKILSLFFNIIFLVIISCLTFHFYSSNSNFYPNNTFTIPQKTNFLKSNDIGCKGIEKFVTSDEKCTYVKSHEGCKPNGYIFYLQLFYCTFSPILGYILLALWLILLFYLLGDTASTYFCSSLDGLSKSLKLSPIIAGVTLLSLGNGAPDFFSSIVSFMNDDTNDIGLNSIIGGAFFVSSVVAGVTSISISQHERKIKKSSFIGNVMFLTLCVVCLLVVIIIGKIHLWGGLGFFLLYLVYVCFIFASEMYVKQEEIGTNDDDSFDLPMVCDMKKGQELACELKVPLLVDEVSSGKRVCVLRKVGYVLELPLDLPRKLTIPNVSQEKWSKSFGIVSITLAPLLLVLIWDFFGPKSSIWACGISGVIGLCCGVLVFFTSDGLHPPKKFNFLWLGLGFLMSITWTYILAEELISLLVSMGLIFGISPSILGLTVLAWGNSLGDLVANVTLAKTGGPIGAQVALCGCYAGPIFNTLVGLGSSLIFTTWKAFPSSYIVPIDSTIYETIGFLLLGLLWALVILPKRDMRLDKFFGVGLLAIYSCFLFLKLARALGFIEFQGSP